MSLQVIKGPLNSGRTGEIRKRVMAVADADPLVVAPTAAARQALAFELCEEAGGAFVGPSVISPDGLAEAILARAGLPRPKLATQAQSLALAREAIGAAGLRILRRSAQSRGFSAALVRLFDELHSDRVDPGSATDSPYLAELLGLYARYLELLEENGLSDRAGLLNMARDALAADPTSWAARPVFLYNFDDLNPAQLNLIRQLAETAPVTISITHEDRRSLAARARLFNELTPLIDEPLILTASEPEYTPDAPLLFHLERHFAEDDPPLRAADPTLRLLRAAGQRGESELIAERVKSLLAGGVKPGMIAIASRDPSGIGPQIAARLRDAGVPVALDARLDFDQTATGAALLDLLLIGRGGGDAGSIIRYLRRTGSGAEPEEVDRLERRLRTMQLTTAKEALAAAAPMRGTAIVTRLIQLAEAGDDGGFVSTLEAAVREIAERTEEAAATRLDPDRRKIEASAARIARATLRQMRRLGGDSATAEAVAAILPQLEVAAAPGPAGDRVRIASPYALYTVRSRRVEHLFVAGLQDGEFPRGQTEGPFLSNEQRAALGMRERSDADAEEMYLFQICLALPTRGLWLSTRVATDDGRYAQPSPFLELIEDLLERDEDGSVWPADCLIERDIAAVTHAPERAPSERELLRALALDGQAAVEGELGESLESEIAAAQTTGHLASGPRPFRRPEVLAALREKTEYGASELETFTKDPGNWYIRNALRPTDFGPDPLPIRLGSLSHAVLEQLYRDPPGEFSKPYPETVGLWQERMRKLLPENCSRYGLAVDRRPEDRVAVLQIERFLERFLAAQAECSEARMEPRYFELGFGSREGSERPPLELEGWSLAGKIDRVDLTPEGSAALIHDYKFAASAAKASDFEKSGLLQLPLYALALRELWKVEPYGALYHPLRAPGERPRGMVRKDDDAAEDLDGIALYGTDRIDPEDFDELIEQAIERAGEAIAGIRAGRIDRPPLASAWTPGPAAAAIHRRFRDRFAEAERDDE